MIVQKHQGFTLVELLIVIAIIGILASIAIPSYQSSVDRSRRAQGQSYALDLAARQERFYAAFGSYTTVIVPGACAGAACGLNLSVNTSDPDGNVNSGWYTAAITPVPASGTSIPTFVITLTPKTGWTDALCGNLTYNNQQLKGNGGTGAVSDCWR